MKAAPDQLRWVIDDVIPHTAALRALMGDVTILPGRDITPDTICDADILLVRSITPVNESLLAGSSVQFVGTATAGSTTLILRRLSDSVLAGQRRRAPTRCRWWNMYFAPWRPRGGLSA